MKPVSDISNIILTHSISLVNIINIVKVEKDNACDKMDACEEAMKTAKVVTLNIQKRPKSFTAQVRAQKGEDEVAELDAKALYNKTRLSKDE